MSSQCRPKEKMLAQACKFESGFGAAKRMRSFCTGASAPAHAPCPQAGRPVHNSGRHPNAPASIRQRLVFGGAQVPTAILRLDRRMPHGNDRCVLPKRPQREGCALRAFGGAGWCRLFHENAVYNAAPQLQPPPSSGTACLAAPILCGPPLRTAWVDTPTPVSACNAPRPCRPMAPCYDPAGVSLHSRRSK